MDFIFPSIDFSTLQPQLILVIAAIAALLLSISEKTKPLIYYISLVAIFLSFFSLLQIWGETKTTFNGMLIIDKFSSLIQFAVLIAAFMTVLVSKKFIVQLGYGFGEYFSLILLVTFGMLLMVSTQNLIILFLGLETMSIGLYVLTGFKRNEIRSLESALKYFLLGAFASGFLLFGIALIFGMTGSVEFEQILDFTKRHNIMEMPLLFVGLGLLIAGFGFKIALVPFHMWTPDVYEGAPTPITGFMSVAVKAVGFGALMRLLIIGASELYNDWSWVLWVLSILTMTVGNIIALSQNNIKRMLAYSSIAHAGYILVGLTCGTPAATQGVIFYLFSYTFMNIGAFGVITYLEKGVENEALQIKDMANLGFKKPLLGLAMTIFIFALAGIPPTAGFTGKFLIFRSAVESGFIGLTIIAVINSVISVYYYLRVIIVMYMSEKSADFSFPGRYHSIGIALFAAAVIVILLGVLPDLLIKYTGNSIAVLP